MIDSYIGVIVPWAGTFAPQGWYFCWGQKLFINSNPALYSILGWSYGGDQKTYFNLPDLRGRIPRGAGTGPGLSAVNVGATGGTAGVNTLNNIPAHTHAAGGSVTITLNATTSNATTGTPSATNVLAKARKGVMFPTIYYTGGTPGTMDIGQLTVTAPAASGTTGTTGSPVGQVAPYDSTPPVMDVNYIICYDGYYPARP